MFSLISLHSQITFLSPETRVELPSFLQVIYGTLTYHIAHLYDANFLGKCVKSHGGWKGAMWLSCRCLAIFRHHGAHRAPYERVNSSWCVVEKARNHRTGTTWANNGPNLRRDACMILGKNFRALNCIFTIIPHCRTRSRLYKANSFLRAFCLMGGTLCAWLIYLHILCAHQLHNHCRCTTYLLFWAWIFAISVQHCSRSCTHNIKYNGFVGHT